jgi:chromosomal replication initiation ATPase DnaA
VNTSPVPRDIAALIAHCAAAVGVHPGMVRDISTHESQVVAARRMAARRMREMGYSFPLIGRYLGGLHHTSVMHLCDRTKIGWKPKLRKLAPWEPTGEVDIKAWDEWAI